MAEKISINLNGVSKTLLMTLYARARETQNPNSIFKDEKAVEMVSRLDCDFKKFGMQRHDEIAVILRMRKFDGHVSDFLRRNPQGVVVHIGCGLDTRFDRTDNGEVEWFDLDVPEVITLRQALIPNENSRYHLLATSVFAEDWIMEVERLKPRPFMFVSEGVLLYFEEVQVRSLFLKLRDQFPSSELVCDAQTPFMIWANNLQLAYGKVDARLRWGLKRGVDVEAWGENIRLLDEWNYFDDDNSNLRAFRWIRMFPPLAKASGIFHYRLG
jgi:O-methyltransferase involved in polyketide biosynthesis